MAIATVLSGIEASSDFVRADPGAGQGIPAVTHTVFLDVGLCDSIVRADRALGNKGGVCTSPQTLGRITICLLYTSPSPRDATLSRMPSSA